MRVSAKNAARPWGFTLVELLTVIAIIAVLATLVSASLSNAQRKGRKALSTSNLRQIVLAFNLYLDDRDKRPTTFHEIVEAKYLNARVLLCPEDRIVQNWAGRLEKEDVGKKPPATGSLPGRENPASAPGDSDGNFVGFDDVPHSYFKSFDYHDDIWAEIDKNTMAGLAACQLHGVGRQRKDEAPSISAYQGLVLRALKDGSVIPRQVFWDAFNVSINHGGATSAPTTNAPAGGSQLPLFLDPAQ